MTIGLGVTDPITGGVTPGQAVVIGAAAFGSGSRGQLTILRSVCLELNRLFGVT
jgi:hypothetical protein